ncbi:MAG: histidinol-phosphate transaminase [Cyclobacteriaceae bacterium]|nr:histidinol-phosphate transaminase [Cyclobacteriaceae bacterium]
MNFELNKLVRSNVAKLKPYSSARDDFRGEASVFLDANENPFPTEYNRYPDPHQKKLKKKIGEIKGVDPNQIFLGNGSDEPIDLLIRAFCEPGRDNVLIPQPTYGMYTVSAEVNAVSIKTIPLTSDFDIDVELTKNTWDDRTKLLFLCSPNNPSGNLLDLDKIQVLLKEFPGIVIVDEAYIDFTNYDGFVPLLNSFPNLVILQTLSKAWGLASLRLGMCFASKEIIAVLNKIKPPYNINGITQQIVLTRLEEIELKNKWVAEIIDAREFIENELIKIPAVQIVYPSQANFLLIKITNAKSVYQSLIAKGIVLRDRSNVLLCGDCLRITIGTTEENKILISELSNL